MYSKCLCRRWGSPLQVYQVFHERTKYNIHYILSGFVVDVKRHIDTPTDGTPTGAARREVSQDHRRLIRHSDDQRHCIAVWVYMHALPVSWRVLSPLPPSNSGRWMHWARVSGVQCPHEACIFWISDAIVLDGRMPPSGRTHHYIYTPPTDAKRTRRSEPVLRRQTCNNM